MLLTLRSLFSSWNERSHFQFLDCALFVRSGSFTDAYPNLAAPLNWCFCLCPEWGDERVERQAEPVSGGTFISDPSRQCNARGLGVNWPGRESFGPGPGVN